MSNGNGAHVGRADAPQGGPAAAAGARQLRRRHRAARDAARGVRALARGARADHVDRRVGGARAPRHPRGLHGQRRRPRVRAPARLGAARGRGQGAGALAAGEGGRQARRRSRRRRDRHRQVRRRRRRRGRDRRVRPAARRGRSRGRARGRRPRASRHRHQQGARVVARRRRRERARRVRGRDRAPLRQPPHRRRADRAARRDRGLPRRRADRLELHADPELPAPVPRAHARHDRGPDPRDRAGRRRRLRLQAADLRRGDPARVVLAQARPARQVDRDALREHDGLAPRPRPDRVREAGREPRRHLQGAARQDHRRPRRVLAVPRPADPVARRVRDDRLLPLGRGAHRHHRRVHQQDGHRRDPRRRPARGDALHRGHGRPDGGRARASTGSSCGGATSSARRSSPTHGGRHDVRLGRLPRDAREAARARRPRAGARPHARRQAARHRLLDLDGDLRPRAVARDRPEHARRAGGPVGVGARARAGDRQRDGRTPARRRTARGSRRRSPRSSPTGSASIRSRSR